MTQAQAPVFFWGASRWLKPILRFAAIAAVCETLAVGALFAAANLSAAESPDSYYLYFVIALIMYMLAVRTFKKRLHVLFEAFIADIRLNIMQHVGVMPLLTFERVGIETLYTALTSDMQALSDLSYTIAATAYAGFLAVGIVVYLLLLSEYVFGLALLIGGIAGVGYSYYHIRMREHIRQVREHESAIFDAIQQLLSGFKELRLNHRKNDAFFYECITPHLTELRQLRLLANRWLTWSYVLTYGVWKLLIIGPVLLLPIVGVCSLNKLLTAIGLLLFIPTSYLVEEIPKIMLAGLTMQRLNRLLHEFAALPPETVAIQPGLLPHTFERLVYRQFTFHYEDVEGRAFFLGPLTIPIRPGEIVFITGANGSGKTTLLKLLTGLYAPDAGQAFLNEQMIDVRQYRSLFTAIFSDAHVFDRFYDDAPVNVAQATALLQELHLDQTVRLVDNTWSTLTLSTGQKKRLALVCALLRDRPVYVFDEWAADQDPQFREYFYRTILPGLKTRGKTVIAVTHDDQYFTCADRILKMEYGQLVT